MNLDNDLYYTRNIYHNIYSILFLKVVNFSRSNFLKDELQNFHSLIIKEIKDSENKLRKLNLNEKWIQISQLIFIAWIDEHMRSSIKIESDYSWSPIQVEYYAQENLGEKFFETLVQSLSNKDTPIFVIEMFKQAFNYGFKGKYSGLKDSKYNSIKTDIDLHIQNNSNTSIDVIYNICETVAPAYNIWNINIKRFNIILTSIVVIIFSFLFMYIVEQDKSELNKKLDSVLNHINQDFK